jgi:two-component system OmpR family sensor kinase
MGRRRDEIADLARDFDLMADRLQQLVQARDQLLHDVSHELRSPLARLHMAIGLVRQDPQRLETSLARVEAEAKRLDEMVDELLTLSRMEAGAPRLDDFFDPAGLVLAVAGDARFEAQETGVQVETVIDPHRRDEVPTVKGNAELVRRALENVVRNGLHHSRPGQRVVVGIAPDWTRRCFVIQVADEGPGVEPAALSVMFEPFVQGPGTAERRGFGLGLAIARRAVLAHGGSIEAGNRPEGGLAVTIRLPFGPMAAAAPDGAEPVADARSKA